MNLILYSYTNPVTSVEDTTINDATNTLGRLKNAEIVPLGNVRWIERGDGMEPGLSGVVVPGKMIDIHFTSLTSPIATQIELLAAMFDPADTRTKTLVMQDTADSNRKWQVTCRNVGIGPHLGKGNCVARIALTSGVLLTTLTTTETTWNPTPGVGQAFSISRGNIEALPMFDFTPTGVGASGGRYKRFITTYNRTRRGAMLYPIDITNGGLSTAALINFTAISLQVNNGAGYNASATTIAYDTVVGTLPTVPFLLFRNGEQMRVTARTGTTSGNLTVVRGVYGSVATSHADNNVLALSKMAFSGADIRVRVGDGNGNLNEVPYWIGTGVNAMNLAVTKIWVPYSYLARAIGTLSASITDVETSFVLTGSSLEGTIDTTDVLFLLESEIVTATNYDPATGIASGLIRAAKGTSAAAHAAEITVRAINEFWLTFGDPLATAPTYSTATKPLFRLDSTNAQWDYDVFALGVANTVSEFVKSSRGIGVILYSSDRDINNVASVDPVVELGVSLQKAGSNGYWQITHPFGYTSAVATNIDRWNVPANQAYMIGSDGTKQVIAANTAANTWQTTASLTLTPASSPYIFQFLLQNSSTNIDFSRRAAMNVASLSFPLNGSTDSPDFGVPSVSLEAEQDVTYDLDGVLANATTGENIQVKYHDIASGQTLRLDTMLETMIYLKDNSNAFSGVQKWPARKYMLKMLKGSNTLTWSASGFSIVVKWRGRSNTFA